ncbi:hypothetical protein SBV1_30050 [Verrucomicrobia bacterium]|nr:hypothetical protein SBV1_30050 [Verrucomicrobiota bacterium]
MKLKGAGHQVFTAQEGSEAISIVREQAPDIILLDFHFPADVSHSGLPAWDGFRLMHWLRGLKEAEHARFMIITGEDPSNLKHRPMAVPVAGFFQKPLDFKALLSAIAKQVAATRPSPAGPSSSSF